MTPIAPPLIELAGVHKSYNLGMPNEAEVLHGVSFVIGRGEFVALIGPSGSGKSTLLNVVGLLERLTAGSYRIQGQETGGLDDAGLTLRRRAVLGFVFQFHHLLPAFSALEIESDRLATAVRE
ncbi:ATP-binding cassette domain-containing protein [Candidatus Accumulibacter contiguus]|jgi:lipoprotein-releasing system ATP-binding protein|uniref:ATP-binding cassette domain-containing protein n=1 Tax=Candidatus Accumulibacter contiguus TaxID=2954381 RepID=A0ABX1TBE5_9PROT|nr:ATP-binding cassette domain-containing protein [Candidatus Accumulibacter contiguus]NMQ06980.1 ATP-binding cassette domain-containing protein [Candidatus Accumulibacter contiguus]